MTEALHAPARAAVASGYHLTTALLNALSPADREKLSMLTTAGASVALTIKWVLQDRVEVRVGVVSDDAQPDTIFALDFDRTGKQLELESTGTH